MIMLISLFPYCALLQSFPVFCFHTTCLVPRLQLILQTEQKPPALSATKGFHSSRRQNLKVAFVFYLTMRALLAPSPSVRLSVRSSVYSSVRPKVFWLKGRRAFLLQLKAGSPSRRCIKNNWSVLQ